MFTGYAQIATTTSIITTERHSDSVNYDLGYKFAQFMVNIIHNVKVLGLVRVETKLNYSFQCVFKFYVMYRTGEEYELFSRHP